MEFMPGFLKAALAIFILGCVIAIPLWLGSLALHYWYISAPIAGLVIWGIVAFMRQKRADNMV